MINYLILPAEVLASTSQNLLSIPIGSECLFKADQRFCAAEQKSIRCK